MSPKSAVFAALALAVVGFALYLFVQVRATPAQAGATHVAERPSPPRETPKPPVPEVEPIAKPAPATGSGSAWWKDPKYGSEVDGPPPPTAPDQGQINLKLDNLMELANKAYDAQDFDQATAIATKVLSKEPSNVRMLRIIVSANCIGGDSVVAQQYYERLPKFDREQMQARCDRYGVSFKEPAQ